jgi:hypothetical protein
MHRACVHNATRATEWSAGTAPLQLQRLFSKADAVVRKKAGDFAMRPAGNHLDSKAFLRRAAGAWHWPREQLQRRL